MLKLLLFILSINTFANIYYIEDLSEPLNINKSLVKKLKENNIKTTNDFLLINKTSKDRALNSQKYKLKIENLMKLVNLFDLLRIKGIGPTVAKLLYESNIKNIRKFQTIDIKKLEKKLIEVNKKLKITPFTPNRENLDVWKASSLKLKIIIL
jgi:alpha-acetolactate decarboxylase